MGRHFGEKEADYKCCRLDCRGISGAISDQQQIVMR